jgi:hypothetical protein
VPRNYLNLQHPDERRPVLLVERDDVEDAEPLAGAEVDLVAEVNHLSIRRLSEVVPVRPWSLYLNMSLPIRGRTAVSILSLDSVRSKCDRCVREVRGRRDRCGRERRMTVKIDGFHLFLLSSEAKGLASPG